MTLVRIALDVPGSAGDVRAVGRIRATPTARRTVGDAIVLPSAFTAALVDGVATVELAATGVDWCWRVEEMTAAAAVRYVVVPDSGTTLGYEDLTDVDPATLDPAVEPEAAWTVALGVVAGDVELLDGRVTVLEEAAPGGGGNVDAVEVLTGTEARPDAILVFWRDMRADQTVAPANMLAIDVWITGEPVEQPPADGISVYGASAPTGTWALATDGTPSITFGRGFYKFNSSDPTNGLPTASIIGARAWLPVGATDLPTEVTFYLFDQDTADLDTPAPVQTKVLSLVGATAGTWVEGTFDAATSMAADGQMWFVGARFTGGADAGKYTFSADARATNDAIVSASGKHIAWSERVFGNRCSWFKIGAGAADEPAEFASSYGIDILVSE